MKMFFLLFILFSSATFISAQDLDHEIPAEVAKISSDFNLSMNTCPHKIWKNYNWNNFLVILTYNSKNQAFKWDGSKNEVRKYDFNLIPPSKKENSYSFFEVDGKRAMLLDMEANIRSKFRLGIHEGFHFFLQNKWEKDSTKGSNSFFRGTAYPLSYKPRYLRKMLFNKLVKAFQTGQDSEIKKAKYWYEQWLAQFPEEAKVDHDDIEGTARYADTVAASLINLDCKVSDLVLKQEVIKNLPQHFLSQFEQFEKTDIIGLDREGYAIGGIASLLLRFTQNNMNWQDEVDSGSRSLLEILFSNYNSIQDSDDYDLKKEFEEAVAKKNNKIGEVLDADILAFSNKDFIRISIPIIDWGNLSLGRKYFIIPSETPNSYIAVLDSEHNYFSPDKKNKIKLLEDTILFLAYDNNPCSSNHDFYTVVQVHKDNIKSSKVDEFTISSDKVSGKLKASEKKNSSGMRFLCPQT